MDDVEEVKKKGKGKESQYGKRYGFEFKFRCVKLLLKEGLPVSLLSKEVGCSQDVIRRCAKVYQAQPPLVPTGYGSIGGALPSLKTPPYLEYTCSI